MVKNWASQKQDATSLTKKVPNDVTATCETVWVDAGKFWTWKMQFQWHIYFIYEKKGTKIEEREKNESNGTWEKSEKLVEVTKF